MFKKNILEEKPIEFWAMNKHVAGIVDPPTPAKDEIPQWYKSLSRFVGPEGKMVIGENGQANVGLKTCASFLDSLTSGYMINLHCDIYVEDVGDGKVMTWSSSEHPLTGRGKDLADQLPKVPGYGSFTQAWEIKYGFRVPKGYSVFITQPFNRFDLPTLATSGVVDADTNIGPGGIPFAVREDFSGIIKAGTPILQLFPFKRDDWKHIIIDQPYEESYNARPRNKLWGWYKETVWKKKSYI